jgi:AraC-like DNA-binding protein
MLIAPHIFLSHHPAAPLGRFVEHLWYWDGPPPAHARDRILPSGCAGLVINLAEDELRDYVGATHERVERHAGAALIGVHSRFTVIDRDEQRSVIGVVFRPGGLAAFVDASDELHNAHIDLRDLWGTRGSELRERVLREKTPQARLRRVESELIAWMNPALQQRAEIEFIIRALSATPHRSIAHLSLEAGLSARRISRLFALQTGLTPKRFARIKRFEHVLQGMSQPHTHWSELAQRCGYFDQSHLINDCRDLSGCTPEELQKRRLGSTRHIPL